MNNNKENVSLSEAIAKQILSGNPVDKNLTEKLIANLCEEFKQSGQGSVHLPRKKDMGGT